MLEVSWRCPGGVLEVLRRPGVVLGGPARVLGRSRGGPGGSLGAKEVSWAVEAGLVGLFWKGPRNSFFFFVGR